MRLLKCPSSEKLFEFVSIAPEMDAWPRWMLRYHLFFCAQCRESAEKIENHWDSFLYRNEDILPSLMKVYGRLKNDETLILKGWKLDKSRHRKHQLLSGWLFRGAVTASVLTVIAILFSKNPLLPIKNLDPVQENRATTAEAQFRFEDSNGVRVHYVKPELVDSLEFTTVSVSR